MKPGYSECFCQGSCRNDCMTVRKCLLCGDIGENCFCCEDPSKFAHSFEMVNICTHNKSCCDDCTTVRKCRLCGDVGENCFCCEDPFKFADSFELIGVCKHS